METYGTVDSVYMKLVCGPVTEHQDGVKEQQDGKKYCNKEIKLNAQYSNNPEDNSFASATPSATLTMSLGNPDADIFRPGKAYRVTITPW